MRNNPIGLTDPTGMCWFCIDETTDNGDGTVTYESSQFLRIFVPGYLSYDNGVTHSLNGNVGGAAANFGIAIGEMMVTVLTFGTNGVVGGTIGRGTSVVSNSGALTRTFDFNGKQIPPVGVGNPVVGRTLRNGLSEIKTSINGSDNDAANLFRNLVGDSVKPLANGKGFRSVLDDGREVIFRPSSSGRSGEIPKIEIRDPNFGTSEKINFTR